jgi:hypothetical protein
LHDLGSFSPVKVPGEDETEITGSALLKGCSSPSSRGHRSWFPFEVSVPQGSTCPGVNTLEDSLHVPVLFFAEGTPFRIQGSGLCLTSVCHKHLSCFLKCLRNVQWEGSACHPDCVASTGQSPLWTLSTSIMTGRMTGFRDPARASLGFQSLCCCPWEVFSPL